MQQHEVTRGRLSTHEREQIAALASRGLKAGQIAQRLNRLPATVNFAMHSMGLKQPMSRRAITYVRGGAIVHSFTPDEDAMVEAMRESGATCQTIADASLQMFGRKRSAATILTRLKMLANTNETQP